MAFIVVGKEKKQPKPRVSRVSQRLIQFEPPCTPQATRIISAQLPY